MNDSAQDIRLTFGRDELIIQGRYETLSICNDILIGLIFLIGSFLFFSQETVETGTWFFVVGSALMLVRPCIRISRRIHLKKLHGTPSGLQATQPGAFDN
ncbi:YrhK family protein [Rothia sp. CCM 9417]|uniref:YrhK family protein n=1 Tax=unclassified Rothia (in: high G+C Gram-positive bacteria) TaxID=2689056 RepID=UPI003ACA90D7